MIKLKRTAAALAAALFLGMSATNALAQDAGCESDEAKQMSFLAGNWNVESRFRVSRNPEKWETTTGKSVVEDFFPGCVWKEEFTGTRDGKPLRVIGLFGFSNITGNLQHAWSHSQHGILTFYEGRMVGDEIVFSSQLSVRGTVFNFRKVIKRTGEGFDARTERSTDGGKTWDTGWFLSYNKAGSKS
ncbi:MAG: DUF1579 family protein [Acidobacteriota bacterium]|nr:MAG: DUF1579 family protein [Acidobacteriota bacterium]